MATPDTKCNSGEQKEDSRKPVLFGESDAWARTDGSSMNLGRTLGSSLLRWSFLLGSTVERSCWMHMAEGSPCLLPHCSDLSM